MSSIITVGPLAAALRRTRAFVFCRRGIAAVEFGLIVPIMLMMFIGTVELSQAITVDRRVSQVASSTADLVARQRTLTSTVMDGYMEIIAQLMSPYSATPMKITVSNVYSTVANPTAYKVCWVYQYNTGANTALTAGGDFPTGQLPTGIVQGGTSVVVVDVSYVYTPVILFHGTSSYAGTGYTFTERFFLKPRLSASIQYGAIAACV